MHCNTTSSLAASTQGLPVISVVLLEDANYSDPPSIVSNAAQEALIPGSHQVPLIVIAHRLMHTARGPRFRRGGIVAPTVSTVSLAKQMVQY